MSEHDNPNATPNAIDVQKVNKKMPVPWKNEKM